MLHEKTVLVEVPEVSLSLDGRLCSGGGNGPGNLTSFQK